ncbi:hypothetical protein PX699_26995 [Sphingobium sp. H39-3-25]|uniref:hypothetical protein n=1 Tax=Sphingobium arseniciresistens TaxID=3030834 RepID=UPI0023B8B43C|nr:hypothetical protein [Sphingobium arseniciresistens]
MELAEALIELRHDTSQEGQLMLLAALALSANAPLACTLDGYRGQDGLVAVNASDGPTLEWNGDQDQRVRLRFGIENGVPIISSLDVQGREGGWVNILRDAHPEYHVDTGVRRISKQQLTPLTDLGQPITQAVLDQYRWDSFWDAPLDLSTSSGRGRYATMVPPSQAIPGTNHPPLPRSSSEISHADAKFAAKGCSILTDGARIVVTFPGVTIGSFVGKLQYTVFRGTNLIRQEVIARTSEPWVAYKFSTGLNGLRRDDATQLRWRDVANQLQADRVEGLQSKQQTPLATANRILAVQTGAGALSVFPEPHKFFWARETAINMRYSWYRKDADDRLAIGIRQNDREDDSEDPANWALYSARPGTDQRMAMFLYPSIGSGENNIDAALNFTHGDRYKPLTGYQVMASHYHTEFGRRLIAAGGPQEKLPDLIALRALGINIVTPIDALILQGFGTKVQPLPGPDQLSIIAASAAAARIHSDSDFLIMPSQEIFGGPLGGHSDLLFSHPTYWDQRQPGQPFQEPSAEHGTIYHIGGADDLMLMLSRENGLVSMPHPRTKGSTGYPEAVKDKDFFLNSRFDGVGMRWGMGLDGSERRLCEYRCWPLLDEMSNWLADKPVPLKHIMAISEVMLVRPGDDIYGSQPVTYVKLAQLPKPDDTSPVIAALQSGDSFWTTGEVLLSEVTVVGTGRRRSASVDLSWTFPLDFIELIWGDGKTVGRSVISTTDLPPNGSKHLEIPLPRHGAKWFRLAAWDVAANGAVSQPIRLSAP